MLNLHSDKKSYARTEERWRKIITDHRQDGNVAVGGIGDRAG